MLVGIVRMCETVLSRSNIGKIMLSHPFSFIVFVDDPSFLERGHISFSGTMTYLDVLRSRSFGQVCNSFNQNKLTNGYELSDRTLHEK